MRATVWSGRNTVQVENVPDPTILNDTVTRLTEYYGIVLGIVILFFGWLVPGGAYLLTRRYVHFAVFALLV